MDEEVGAAAQALRRAERVVPVVVGAEESSVELPRPAEQAAEKARPRLGRVVEGRAQRGVLGKLPLVGDAVEVAEIVRDEGAGLEDGDPVRRLGDRLEDACLALGLRAHRGEDLVGQAGQGAAAGGISADRH